MNIMRRANVLDKQVRALMVEIIERISKIPQNTAVNEKGPICFTINSKDLGPNATLCPYYHDFRAMKRELITVLKRADTPIVMLQIIEHLVKHGRIQTTTPGFRSLNVHPEFIDHVKKIFTEELNELDRGKPENSGSLPAGA